jgi:hypothetical protein
MKEKPNLNELLKEIEGAGMLDAILVSVDRKDKLEIRDVKQWFADHPGEDALRYLSDSDIGQHLSGEAVIKMLCLLKAIKSELSFPDIIVRYVDELRHWPHIEPMVRSSDYLKCFHYKVVTIARSMAIVPQTRKVPLKDLIAILTATSAEQNKEFIHTMETLYKLEEGIRCFLRTEEIIEVPEYTLIKAWPLDLMIAEQIRAHMPYMASAEDTLASALSIVLRMYPEHAAILKKQVSRVLST